MNHLVKTFRRDEIIKNMTAPLRCNTIVIPIPLWKRTEDICFGENEKAGWVICRKGFYGDFITYIAECIYVSTEGSAGSVSPKYKLTLENDYSPIEFHVHPQGLGNYWHNKFSDFGADKGDFAALKNRMRTNLRYKHILFTPSHILTFGKEKPDIRIARTQSDNETEIRKREEHWMSVISGKIYEQENS